MIREEVTALVQLGPLPGREANSDALLQYQDLLASILPPVTDQEAGALAGLFGIDDSFGLAWTIVHLIETAPNWPLEECLRADGSWIDILRRRANK